MFEPEFVSKVLEAFSKIKGEIDEKGGEFDFRYALVDYLFRDVLGWTRKAGEGHLKIERERKDILFYDDSDPPLPVLIVETVNPNEESASHIGKLDGYLKEMGRVRHGILTNGHDFSVYEYERNKKGERINKRLELDIDEIVHKGVANLTEGEKGGIIQLRIFVKDRFVKFGEVEYFKTYRNDIPLNYKSGYDLFIDGLKKSLKKLNGVFTQFFNAYETRGHISGERLGEAFENWKKTRVGGEIESQETFCKETAYILLNRILFTRICEDKGIIYRYTGRKISREALAVFVEDHRSLVTPYLNALEDAFEIAEREYERIYRANIFDWWRMERAEKYTLNNEEKKKQVDLEKELNYTIRNVLKRFNHFDFKTVNSDILGHVYEDYLSKEERKKLGEYYTPPEVVRYILDAVGYIPTEDIAGKKLLDPSCGSGTFLVEATKRLIDKFLVKFHRREIFRLEPDDASIILESIKGSIYGLDINVFACHIAEMNLFFQTIDLYENIKRKYPEETFEGFNIFCTDSLLPTERKLGDFTDVKVKPFLNNQKEIVRLKGRKFDFVVGNPPYVRKEKIPTDYKESLSKLKEFQEIYRGDNDLCVYFIKKGADWLNDCGKFGYIVSGKFTKARYGKYIRAYIAMNYTINQLIDLRGSKIFKEATNDPIILILEKVKTKKNEFGFVRVMSDIEEKTVEEKIKKMLNRIERYIGREYKDEYIQSYKVAQEQLIENIKEEKMSYTRYAVDEWILIPAESYKTFKKIEENSNCLLGELCEIRSGIETGFNEGFILTEEEANKKVLERNLLKPLLRGEDIKRWLVSYKGRQIIYTEGIKSEKDFETYPNIKTHLSAFKDKLKKRKKILCKGKAWYQLCKPLTPELFESKKVVFPRISARNNFAYDDGGYYSIHTVCLLARKKKKDIIEEDKFLKYLLGLLNSAVLENYFKQIGRYLGRKGYEYEKQYLEKLPIKLLKTEKDEKLAEEITNKVEQILKHHKELSELKNKISEFPDSYISEELHPLLNVMEGQELPKESYSPSRLRIEVEDIAGKTIYKVAITKKDYIAFKTESSAKFLLEVLKRKDRIIKNDLLRMDVPSDADVEGIMREYKGDLEKIEGLKREINVLDNGIDELVYELYGMDEGDRKMIEDGISGR